MFVTFEGPEGAGKSLQSRELTRRLVERGIPTLLTREPGGTPLGDQVRQLVLLQTDLETVARAEALLMCAARAQLVESVIRPALERGEVVVCDRFADSTLAYQGSGRGLLIDELAAVISFATAGLAPDLTVLLDVPVGIGLARKEAQAVGTPAWNRFEDEARAFHERIRDGYQQLAVKEPHRWVCLDALKPADVLADEIFGVVWSRLERT